MYSLLRSISLVWAPYHFLISKISRMFCSPWIASRENLTNVLTLLTTYMTIVWRPMVCGDLWWMEPRPQLHCQLKNRLLTQWQLNILHYSRLWCTILQVLPNQSYTIANIYSSLIVAMSLQLTKNHSIILVPMEETLLHKLQSTSGGSLRAGHLANWPAVNTTLPGCFTSQRTSF